MAESNLFLYRAAHDLRAPLMSVKGLIHIMRTAKERNDLDHYFTLMEQSVDKMNQSIDTLLEFSKNEQVSSPLQPVDFRTLAEEVSESVQYMAGAKTVRIDISVEQETIFCSDHAQLYSILVNLLSNAVLYRDITKLPFVCLTIVVNNEIVRLHVKDNGIGIEKKFLDKIFEKYFRITQDPHGSGLGLFIVKTSVENLGGTIEVQSTPGLGTQFEIQIPNRAEANS
jgi:signal transduction histidine kinase